jgi:hypothetical protein
MYHMLFIDSSVMDISVVSVFFWGSLNWTQGLAHSRQAVYLATFAGPVFILDIVNNAPMNIVWSFLVSLLLQPCLYPPPQLPPLFFKLWLLWRESLVFCWSHTGLQPFCFTLPTIAGMISTHALPGHLLVKMRSCEIFTWAGLEPWSPW